ncbi:type II toxin-antitoxin system HicB family antitoxin [Geminocystis sp. GBBB08]|uniref:type II toxin-antitoxin system HicB family antitoxin n=1 Tax=Geminocystis sp. GBBB08 TaxID=2604140 RepID=UPI0027E32E58|nr:type II toxin-antitoxin system HicB family antitoxin [Geminocystis sp. GBBB08]MBL1211444.1 type II toxin-antitoxin system HicB family antitoxin [Geminocystis sp. GBBB08]
MLNNIQVKCEIFQEDDLYVGICPELNVSSFGETIEEAKASLREALMAFLEECEEMNTLQEVLQEAGFIRENNVWLPRKPVVSELMAIA